MRTLPSQAVGVVELQSHTSTSLGGFHRMVSTLANAAKRKRLRQQFAQDSADALAVMKATGTGHALADVRGYFSQLKEHRQGQSAPPAPLRPKKMG